MPITHLSAQELADRWRIGRRTLDRWRWIGEGPAFFKLGGRVVYRLQDIEAYEADRLRQVTGPLRASFEEAERIAAPIKSRRRKPDCAEIRATTIGKKSRLRASTRQYARVRTTTIG